MPGARLPMRKIRDVLRLRTGGMSKRQMATSLSIGPTAAGDCIRRARLAGVSWPLPKDLSDEAPERVLYLPLRITAKDRHFPGARTATPRKKRPTPPGESPRPS